MFVLSCLFCPWTERGTVRDWLSRSLIQQLVWIPYRLTEIQVGKVLNRSPVSPLGLLGQIKHFRTFLSKYLSELFLMRAH